MVHNHTNKQHINIIEVVLKTNLAKFGQIVRELISEMYIFNHFIYVDLFKQFDHLTGWTNQFPPDHFKQLDHFI